MNTPASGQPSETAVRERTKLTDLQKQAIHYLVMDRWSKNSLNTAVAGNVGVQVQTVISWRKEPIFQQEYDRQVKLYRANFDDVQLADRKERVLKLEKIYGHLTDSQTSMKIKILAAIRSEVGDDKIEVEVTHQGQVGVNLPPRAASYEEWAAQNELMDKNRVIEEAEIIEDAPLEAHEPIPELPPRHQALKEQITTLNDQSPVGVQ
jgi:hypothetical protein